MTKRLFLLAVILTVIPALNPGLPRVDDAPRILSLAGTWGFRLDPEARGLKEEWFASPLEGRVQLPGTTDTNGMGKKIDERRDDRLSRVYDFKGPAWYQRRLVLPADWAGKTFSLFLERTKWTRVWVDRLDCGTRDGLSGPQIYELPAGLKAGEHTLTILVDNANVPPVGPAHALDERTQTNWNGIIGRIELRASDPVRLDDVQVTPDVGKRSARVRVLLAGDFRGMTAAALTLRAESRNTSRPAAFSPLTTPLATDFAGGPTEIEYALGPDAPLWDEFDPALIRLTVSLEGLRNGRAFRDVRTLDFGLREFRAKGTQFAINGRITFLRGKNDACIFPLTGFPPMDTDGWRKVFFAAKSYGINHYRFHTWCPPEAAFQAADELGLYLQPELPNKVSFEKPEHAAYLRKEGERILRAFGNHPSFVMMTLGNELGGSREMMAELVDHFRRIDPRHLYAQGTNNYHWEPALAPGDDFWVTAKTAADRPVRGSFYQGDYDKAIIETRSPSTLGDFADSLSGLRVPVVGHENGQFQVSPDFREIPKYTGVLRARNLEIFRERLAAAHMLDQADRFVRASGALSVICYREDIELALRTPGFGGFQLLDLQDFPGQGTALVGILDAFMDSKGLIAPEAWRRFCSETVPLLRFEKYTWTTEETFQGRVQIAHFGKGPLPAAAVVWTIKDEAGRPVGGGEFKPKDIALGLAEIGDLRAALTGVRAPARLTVEIGVKDSPYANAYSLWVYPSRIETAPPTGVRIIDKMDEAAWSFLRRGGSALLLPLPERLPFSVAGSFQTDFWCFPMFRRAAEKQGLPAAPGTLGILCDPRHPALAGFPTDFHSDWQWWHLVKNSRPVVLDETPPDYRPSVQVIDNFERNHKLGLIFETRVGKGRLLVCSIGLLRLQERPEARQLLQGLLRYAGSDRFAPAAELPAPLLKKLFPAG